MYFSRKLSNKFGFESSRVDSRKFRDSRTLEIFESRELTLELSNHPCAPAPGFLFQAGGAPRDGFDRPAAGRFLGTEALGGLKLRTEDWISMPFVVGMQAGVFIPDDPDDLTVTKVVVHAGIGL